MLRARRTSWRSCRVRSHMEKRTSPQRSPPHPGPGALIAELRGILHLTAPDAIPLPHRIPMILKLCASTLPETTPFMPRLRGKSRTGTTWYAARGRKMPNLAHLSDTKIPCADIPPDFDVLSVLPSITVPAPTEPQLEPLKNFHLSQMSMAAGLNGSTPSRTPWATHHPHPLLLHHDDHLPPSP